MTILEIGIYCNSILILSRSFHPLKKVNKSLDIKKRSFIINQIREMSKIVLKGNLEILDNSNYRILFMIPPHNSHNIFLYSIDDKTSSEAIVRNALNDVIYKFEQKYSNTFRKKIIPIDHFQSFSGIIDDTLSDERYTPADRIRNYLF